MARAAFPADHPVAHRDLSLTAVHFHTSPQHGRESRVTFFTSLARNPGYDLRIAPRGASDSGVTKMAAISRAFARALSDTSFDTEVLNQIALLCASGLLASVLMINYGVDLGAAF